VRRRSVGLGLLALLLSYLSGAGCAEPPPAPDRPPPNVILAVIDTLRADRVGWIRDGVTLTPFLDELASRGAVLPNAFAQAPETRPSVASLFTSRYPLQHGVQALNSVLPERERTVAEVLHEHGWVTAGFCANPAVLPNQGFAQGFDRFDVPDFFGPKDIKERARDVNARALAWLGGLGDRRPFFLYLQYMEPHTPYTVPANFLEALLEERRRPQDERARSRKLMAQNVEDPFFLTIDFSTFDRSTLGPMRDVYDAEVRDLDRSLATFFGELERRGLLENTVVIVTADHGEEFLEHVRVGHGGDLFQQAVHIPLAIVGPGVLPGQRLDAVVSHVDLGPTVLGLAGLAPEPTFEGRSIAPALGTRWWVTKLRALFGQEPDVPPPVAFLTQPEEETLGGFALHDHALVEGTDKVVVRRDGEVLAYDLADDPGEQVPHGLDAARRDELLTRLKATQADLTTRAGEPVTGSLDDRQIEGLRGLGYIAD
jgi:arylsulfatase A-like enzyme